MPTPTANAADQSTTAPTTTTSTPVRPVAADTTQSAMPGTVPATAAAADPIHHRLIGIELPARNYAPRDQITVLDPWDKPMVLMFSTFLNPVMVGPVVLTVQSDSSGHIPSSSQFLANARTIAGRTYIVWTRLTLPNGRIGWLPPGANRAGARR